MATSLIKKMTNDSGWQSVGNVYYRKIGNVVFLECGNATETHNTLLATLPAGYRPSRRHTAPISFPLSQEGAIVTGYMNVTTDGGITPIFGGLQTTEVLYFSTSFIAG